MIDRIVGKAQTMRLEKSCGAVIYKVEDGRLLFLIEHTRSGHTSIPKGHVEGSETELETAVREIKEETNLDVKIDSGFRKTVHYLTKKGEEKEVVFFAAVPLSEDLVPQEKEIKSLEWMTFEDAYDALDHPPHRDALKEAYEYITVNMHI